jgi:hypothetical protein
VGVGAVNAGAGGGSGMQGEPCQAPAHGHFVELGSLWRTGALSPLACFVACDPGARRVSL